MDELKISEGAIGQAFKGVEKPLIAMGTLPWDALWRAAASFSMLPMLAWLGYRHPSGWILILDLLALLIGMRICPAIIRKVFPFPPSVKQIWTRRRALAKAYDSYQWQKLLYVGIGLAAYLSLSRMFGAFNIILCSFCIVSGGAGLFRWRVVARQLNNVGTRSQPPDVRFVVDLQ